MKIVLMHQFSFTKFSANSIVAILTFLGLEEILFVLDIINDDYINWESIGLALTGIGVISTILGLLLTSIMMSQMVYGKNFIKKTKSGKMHGGPLRNPPSIVAVFPKYYSLFIDFMVGFFLVWWVKSIISQSE